MKKLTIVDYLNAMLDSEHSIVFTGFRNGSGVVTQTKEFAEQLNFELHEINCTNVDQQQFRTALSDVISAASNDKANHLLLLTGVDATNFFVKREVQAVTCYRTDANQLRNPENLQIICFSNQLEDFDQASLQRWTNICQLRDD